MPIAISPQVLEALIILAARYTPALVMQIIGLFQKPNPTVDDIHALFDQVKPYEFYFPTAPTPRP